jgi:hypothetical protein
MQETTQTAQPARKQRKHGGLTIVAGYAIACGVIYLLQLFPYSGIFLMLVAAMLWIGILIHVGMIHLTIGSLGGRISRAWLVLPAAFYIGGLALYCLALYDVRTQTNAIEQANAAVTIKPEQPFTYTFTGYGYTDTRLLELYRTDRMVLPLGPKSRDGAATAYYYGHGDACDAANKNWYYDKRFEPFLRVRDLFPQYKGADKTRQCLISQNGPLEQTRYRINEESTNTKSLLVDRYGTKWTVYDATTGAALLTTQSAEFSVIYPIPMIFAGCGLNDGAARWECGGELMKTFGYSGAGYRPDNTRSLYPSRDPATWAIRPLAQALSLEPRQPTD